MLMKLKPTADQTVHILKNSFLPYLMWKVFASVRAQEWQEDEKKFFMNIDMTLGLFQRTPGASAPPQKRDYTNIPPEMMSKEVIEQITKLADNYYSSYFDLRKHPEKGDSAIKPQTIKELFYSRLELEPYMPNWKDFNPQKEHAKRLLGLQSFYPSCA